MIKLGRSFWWILLLIGVSFFASQLPWLTQNPIFLRLAVALVIVFVASALLTGLSMLGISINRTTRTARKQVGEVISEEYELINRSIIPKAWLRVTDLSDLRGGSGSKLITGIGGRQSRTYVAYTMLQKRGWFCLGPTKIESGDIFGLFLFQKTYANNQRLLVIPYMVDIQFFLAPFGILPGGHALREKTLEVTPYAAGVREYVPGDPLKRIHWPSSARKQVLIVKEFEKDPLAEVWVFLDARSSVHIQGVPADHLSLHEVIWVGHQRVFKLSPDTMEYAISIAASVVKYYLRENREVGLVSAGQNYTVIPAERGERQLGKILETLAVLQPEGEMPLWALVNSQISHLARGSTVILITPAADEKIMTIAMELVQRGLIPVIILIDGSSFGGMEQADKIEKQLVNQGLITFVIREGSDIKSVLETSSTSFDYRVMFHRS